MCHDKECQIIVFTRILVSQGTHIGAAYESSLCVQIL